MGIYFNPDNESFQKDVNSEIYVDKTGLLEELNQILSTVENCIALSHAPCFGKSQAARMISAYYGFESDSKELFSRFKIAEKKDFEEHLNKYNVIHLDVSSFVDFHNEDLVETIINVLCDEFQKEVPGIERGKDICRIIMQVYKITGRKFVIILDEWDCVVRNYADCPELVQKYFKLLHSLFKSEESRRFLALAYITGILPIKQVSDESALNNFWEYTMLDSKNLTSFFGFTEEEVKELCRKYEMDFDLVKKWYNGYFIQEMNMYNPESVAKAMVRHKLDFYWQKNSAIDTINTYINLNYDGLKEDILKMLSGTPVPVYVDTFLNDFSIINSRDEALTALIHLGYLGYDTEWKQAYIPNFEVGQAYRAALASGNGLETADMLN